MTPIDKNLLLCWIFDGYGRLGSGLTDPKVKEKMSHDGWQANMTINSEMHSEKTHSSTVAKTDMPSSFVGRMERELASIDALGFKSQSWTIEADEGSSVSMPVIDVQWLVAQRDLPYLIQALPSHLLYRSVCAHGIEDSLEVIEWIRGPALVKMLDFDLWADPHGRGHLLGHELQPSANRFIQWIKWWNEITPDFAAQRVMELDEGLIIGCMTAACEIVPVGLNRSIEELSDDYWMTPDNRFGLKMKTDESSDFDVFHQFIHTLYKQDIRLAQSVLAHSAMLVREESIEEARRWRAGRLQDQGFLDAEEARHVLMPKSHRQLEEMVRIALSSESKRVSGTPADSDDMLASGHSGGLQGESWSRDHYSDDMTANEELTERIYEFIQSRDRDELANEIEHVLGTSEIVRLVGTSAPSSEILVEDEDVMEAFVDKMTARTHQIVLQLEAEKLRALKAHVQQSVQPLLFDQVIAWIAENNTERVMALKARIARTTNTVAAAMDVDYNSTELDRVLSAVRGCLNIGLERMLAEPENFNIHHLLDVSDSHLPGSALRAVRGARILQATGPELIFQIGWQTLQDLSQDAVQYLVYSLENHKELKEEIGTDFGVRLGDGETLRLSVLQLQSRGRYPELRKWWNRWTGRLDSGVEHILNSTLNRLPVFPILLLEDDVTTRGTVAVRPYERLEEVEKTRIFMSRMGRLVTQVSQGE